MAFDRWVSRASMRIRALFSGARLDNELDEELRDHIERTTEANIARGITPDEARRAALIAIGGLEQRKEECRDARHVRYVDDFIRDVRYALRTLVRAPAFTSAAVLTLTLGIGATVAIFTLVNGVLLRPMPFPQPDRLFLVAMSRVNAFVTEPVFSDYNYLAFRERQRAFAHLATFSSTNGNLTGGDDPAVIKVGSVTTEFFDVLGVAPAVGRTFAAADAQTGREPTIVVSDRLWRSRFDADPNFVGRTVRLDGVSRLVVGIMPAGFDFPNKAQAWTPQVVRTQPGNSLMFPVIGRLKPEITLAQARAQFDTFVRQLPQPPDTTGAWNVGLFPLKDYVVGRIRRPLLTFAGAVAIVLLIACANVANLLLARASGRQRELAVRAALGASRRRLIRQLLTESAVLSLTGGALGILLSRWAVSGLLALAPNGRIPRLEMIRIDGWVLSFALGASLFTAVLFGLAPALTLTRRRFGGTLLPAGRTFGAGQERLRAGLVVAEIALALMLVTGAGLLIKSFMRLRAVDSGYDTRNAVALNVELPTSVYGNAAKLHEFHQDLLGRLSTLPGIVSAGAVNWVPLGGMHLHGDYVVEGGATGSDLDAEKPAASGGYFRAMGIPLVRGRDFDQRDTASSGRVAVVSRAVAKTIDPSEDAIGKRVSVKTNPGPQDWMTVVGIVGDVKPWGPSQRTMPTIYQAYRQVQQPFFLSRMTYIVRTASNPERLIPEIRAALRDVDRDQPATSIVLMDDVLDQATAEPAFQARLLTAFAILALALCIIGTYGVLTYAIVQRTHEIGIRLALGARAASLVWDVVRRTVLLALVGVGLGVAGAAFATRLLTTFLFEVRPTDPATFAAVALTIFTAALTAGLVSARRATRIDPLVALRHE